MIKEGNFIMEAAADGLFKKSGQTDGRVDGHGVIVYLLGRR